jgi:hypothetical protein
LHHYTLHWSVSWKVSIKLRHQQCIQQLVGRSVWYALAVAFPAQRLFRQQLLCTYTRLPSTILLHQFITEPLYTFLMVYNVTFGMFRLVLCHLQEIHLYRKLIINATFT